MSEPVPQDHLPKETAPAETCAYCGASLDPGYYFCLTCATPYKAVESVLPRPRPAYLSDGRLIATKAPHVAPLFWTYFAVVVGAAVAGFALFQNEEPALTLVFQSGSLFITTCIFAALHWPSLVVQFKRFGFHNRAALIGFLVLPVLLLINYVYHGWVMRALGGEGSPLLSRRRESGLGEPALILLICASPAILEEIAFRGLVQHWLSIAIRPFHALVLASVLFTILHFSLVSAPYLFAVGMLLGWTKMKTGSLYPSMVIHFLHNLIVLEFFWH